MKAKKRDDGIFVDFKNPPWYYAHSIKSEGKPDDAPGIDSMWGWINHLREKNWWTAAMEQEFKREVSRLL